MSDDNPQQDAFADTTEAVVGEWLRNARESQSLSVDAVADALHLDASIVDALEREAFAELGATVFAKGHLRAVAGYLGLEEGEADARFRAVSGIGKDDLPELIVQYNRPLRARSRLPVIAGLVVAALIVAAGLLYAGMQLARGSAQPDAQQVVRDPEPATATQPAAVQNASVSQRQPQSQTSAPKPARNTPATGSFADKLAQAGATAAAATPASTPSDAQTRDGLRLSFAAECWFEVRDAGDRRIAYGTARAGTERIITGQRPFAVTLGVAEAVSVQVDGQPFPISAAMRRGRAAKFSIP